MREKCLSSGEMVTVSAADRLRGGTHCPRCGQAFKVGMNTKQKVLPKHISKRSV